MIDVDRLSKIAYSSSEQLDKLLNEVKIIADGESKNQASEIDTKRCDPKIV